MFIYDSVPTGRVIFEIGGVPIREELARDSASFNNLYIIFIIIHWQTALPIQFFDKQLLNFLRKWSLLIERLHHD